MAPGYMLTANAPVKTENKITHDVISGQSVLLVYHSHQRWLPPTVVGGPCVQGLEWPSTSRVILCQWHSAI